MIAKLIIIIIIIIIIFIWQTRNLRHDIWETKYWSWRQNDYYWSSGLSTKKIHNLKVENYVLFGGLMENYSSQIALRNFKRSKEAASMYRSFCWKNKHVVEHQKMTANHKKQTSQVNDFSASLCMGRCKSLGLLKSFLWYAS